MKNFAAAALCLLLIVQKSKAQFTGTDQSSSQKSWEQVLKLAADQKKFILLYGSTRNGISETVMQEQVFSKPSVANLLNDNFIFFKVSLDSNSEKSGSSQEKLAQNLKAQFRQASLPLFLFYSPEGKLVHAGAGQARENDFLALMKNGMDSSKQYFTQLAKFRRGEFSYDKLPYLITVSQNLNEHSTGQEMASAYLDYVYKLPVSEQLTTGRLMLMKQYVQNSQDKGFILFEQHAQEIDKIMHQKGFAANMIIDIIQRETITPFLNISKEKNTPPDWHLLQQTARKKYDTMRADMAVLNEQIDWYINKRQFNTAAKYYFERTKYGYDTSAYGKMFVNNFLYTFLFKKVEEKELLQSGVALIKELLETSPNKASWLDTYASLLYKLGHKNEAIAIEEKALKAEPTDEEIAETYQRMKRGEQIWISKVTYHDSPLGTRWGNHLSISTPLSEYPRPQLRRSNWTNLNGQWDYSITDSSLQTASYNDKILVPFPIESKLSGVQKGLLPDQKLWYKRTFDLVAINPSKKYLLHFGAVDYQATVWVNDQLIGSHTGGYQSFSMDITRALKKGKNKLSVAVLDPTDKGDNPRGKQSLNPRGILYTPTSGIWQTVWMEAVPSQYIEGLKVTTDVDGSKIHLEIAVNGAAENGYTIQTLVSADGKIVAQMNHALGAIDVKIPSPRLWSPDDPFLYDLSVRLHYKGKLIDSVASYFGMRKIDIQKDSQGQARIFLNNKYTFNLGVLDQGFWPDGLYTAPSDSALRWDIEVMKKMGFNTLRKHIKIEPDRWYYWCDKLGMLVWQDMPMPAGPSATAKAIFEKECNTNIEQLYNHPSIICWVLFNEGWNRYDQARLTAWMQQKDPSRLINGHSGENYDRNAPSDPREKWANSDMADIHDYPGPAMPPVVADKALVLGEWGGIRVATPGHQWKADGSWGYIESDKANFARKYQFMMRHLKLFEEEGLSGAIYTQPFDVELEENGLITYDREVIKIPIESMNKINSVIGKEVSVEQTFTNIHKR